MRKLKNLKGLVPGVGKGEERVRRQGVRSENSWGRKVAMLSGKDSSHRSFTNARSSFLVMGREGVLLVQVWFEP